MAALVMLAIAMLGIGVLTSKTVKEVQLMRDAETTALRWAQMFKDRRDDTWTTFRERRSSKHANSIIWNSREVGRILAYELYDRNGRMFYSTGPADWIPDEKAGALLDSPITRKHIRMGVPTTRLHEMPASRDGPSQYASVVVPFYLADSYLGSIVTFVDQSEQAKSLTYSFGVIAIATALLLLTAIGAAAYVVISKSRERWRAEAQVRYLSDHDELTGLPNRHSFNKRLGDTLASPDKKDKTAVIFLDINRFKEINDAMGHAAGDAVLRSVAKRIHVTLGDTDYAARLGSNEFAIALTTASSASEVAVFATRLREALNAPYAPDDEEIAAEAIDCTFSMGAAISPSDGDDQASLTRHANLALNRAKAEGPGAFKFFERSMDIAFQRRREREQDLRNAVERGEFELLFQPQICSGTNAICGQEALLRWKHPVHGTISPAYFVPLAEETKLIVPIGEWVLRRACEEAAAWTTPANVAVNLSPVQFKNAGIADDIRRILDETGLEPGRLEVEITESVLMGDTEAVVSELKKLRDHGVAIAMDDFGTGYSSLSYISSFPFNKIKIDKTFVQSMTRDEALNAIVKCIVAMGQSLEVTITAEGVETEEQAALLRGYGCHQMQGYLYGHPANARECAVQMAEAPADSLALGFSGKSSAA